MLLDASNKGDIVSYIHESLDYLHASRPTAVDLANAITLLKNVSLQAAQAPVQEPETTSKHPLGVPQAVSKAALGTTTETSQREIVREAYIVAAEKIFRDDYVTNLAIGRHGAEFLRAQELPHLLPIDVADRPRFFSSTPPDTEGAASMNYEKISVLTHCNTGYVSHFHPLFPFYYTDRLHCSSLATSGHGTALGIIRSLHQMNYLQHAFCTETRPYNQGSRLTAFELDFEKIPSTLITDSMAGALFFRKRLEKNITAVIVGADRVVRNGDTANKVGTYSLAVLARQHGIKFIVAAPTTSIDLKTLTGQDIKIEDRAQTELTQISGAVVDKDGNVDVKTTARVAIAHQGIDVWNPSFDVTPHAFIDAIVTENGVVVKEEGVFNFRTVMPERWQVDVG